MFSLKHFETFAVILFVFISLTVGILGIASSVANQFSCKHALFFLLVRVGVSFMAAFSSFMTKFSPDCMIGVMNAALLACGIIFLWMLDGVFIAMLIFAETLKLCPSSDILGIATLFLGFFQSALIFMGILASCCMPMFKRKHEEEYASV